MKSLLLSVFVFLFASLSFAQIPVNYYQPAENLSGSALQDALHQIIDNHTVVSYSYLWGAFYNTDATGDGHVWDIYSDIPGQNAAYQFTFGSNQCGNYSAEGDCYNREHAFPKSWFNDQAPMESDLFHIYPTDGWVNNKRGNLPYGETTEPTWTSTNGSELGPCSTLGYTGTVFEPIDEYKGDLARSYFYMATRYYSEDSGWTGSDMVAGSQPKPWALAMLLRWHLNDPVSPKEIARNEAIYGYQHNRNPFIDHPEYATQIWTGDVPNELAKEPSNHVADFSGSFIELKWNDAIGEHLPSGYLILMDENGFDRIPVPTDNMLPSTYPNAKSVEYGKEHCTFYHLKQNQTYYFKIYSYTSSGTNIDYKTDGVIPQLMQKTN